VTLSRVEAEESFFQIDQDRRKCMRAENEYKSRLFDVYTRENCLMEAFLEIASEKVGCIPWNFPKLESKSHLRMCSSLMELHSFTKVAADLDPSLLTDSRFDQCLPPCTYTTYHLSYSKRSLEDSSLSECEELIGKNLFWNGSLPYNYPHKLVNGNLYDLTKVDPKFCLLLMKKSAIVYIQPDRSNEVQIIVKHRRVTVISQIAEFGALINMIALSLSMALYFRWFGGLVHGNEYFEPNGNRYLDLVHLGQKMESMPKGLAHLINDGMVVTLCCGVTYRVE